MKYKYKVNGLDCANCTQKLEDALNKKEEINDCVISFATGMMTFESNQEINDNELLSFMQSIEDEVTIDNLSTNKISEWAHFAFWSYDQNMTTQGPKIKDQRS